MTPDAYRKALGDLGLSGRAFGRLCGVNERTQERWVEQGPPPPVVVLLRALGIMTIEQRERLFGA